MSGSEKRIKVSNIANYYENPRHPIASDEFDTLKKLFDSVGIPQMLNLASDIKAHGLLPCNRIVVVYSEFLKKYVVYEGNRRVAAIKLLLYPDTFTFLDKATIDKVKKIVSGPGVDLSTSLNCYVTDETEAFFIMERLHSGEDHGRGLKSWDAREKENFKVRQGNKQSLSNLIFLYVQKYCDGLDITTILPFTTIQRIFNNRKVRTKIGLDVSNEATFTPDRINLVVEASKWIVAESNNSQMSITRLFNTSDTISDKLCPWIDTYHSTHPITTPKPNPLKDSPTKNSDTSLEDSSATNETPPNAAPPSSPEPSVLKDKDNSPSASNLSDSSKSSSAPSPVHSPSSTSSGGAKNQPYFFQGLDYSKLDPNDSTSHGVSAVCRELQLFSDKKLVSTYPLASAFLTRSIIEQSIKYYSQQHYIQGQSKLIWTNIERLSKLSQIIDNYKRNLANYITDTTIRDYFTALFDNYNDTVNPLNWVVHRPSEFQLDASTLIELPRKGLLTVINYFLTA